MASTAGIAVKKQFGQHFLREQWVVNEITHAVTLTKESSVFEIGCGDGFLTEAILAEPLTRLWIFEIDPEWAQYVSEQYGSDKRLVMHEANILDVDFTVFQEHAPWTLLANLPYQITFPILHMLQKNRSLLKEGVIMVQEEVAQKIVKNSGRGYGAVSLYFQHFFDWKLLSKIAPTAFFPPPKVTSRLLYFKPKAELDSIPDEPEFWKFVEHCFRQPRRTLRNNLQQVHYNTDLLSQELLAKRAQQLQKKDLIELWKVLNPGS